MVEERRDANLKNHLNEAESFSGCALADDGERVAPEIRAGRDVEDRLYRQDPAGVRAPPEISCRVAESNSNGVKRKTMRVRRMMQRRDYQVEATR